MSFRSSFCRILRNRKARCALSNSISTNAQASGVTDFMARSNGALSVGKHAFWIDRQSHIYSRTPITFGRTQMSGCHPSYASGLCTMHCIMFSNYQQSRYSMRDPNFKAVLELKRLRSRFFSSGPDLPFPVLWTLIGANVAVFALWQTVNYRFMDRHFTVSIESVLSGRLHTILTSAFSQRDPGHLLSNLIGLYFFGSEIARIFGGRDLLTLYLAGAVGGSVGHLFYFAYIYPWLKDIPRGFYNTRHTPGALGASGAVATVVLLHILLYPKHTLLFYMVIPMPAALVGAVIIGRDLWLAKQGDADVSVGAHLGGAVVAVLAFLAKRSYWF